MADDVTIRMRLQGALKTAAETRKVAGEFDNLGDQARQAARKIQQLNKASKDTRISLGPFSTSARGGVLALGAFANAAGPATAGILGLVEATGSAVGGGGAAGGVGLLALAQGMGVVKLATNDLAQAFSGNKQALARLSPQQREFLSQLNDMRPLLDKLRGSAAGGVLSGLLGGAHAAAANFGVVNRIVRQTSHAIGGLARDGGRLVGSRGFGRDLATLGRTNVHIIDNLGHAGLNLANAARHVLVEAAPLADWLSRMALSGSRNALAWVKQARAGGQLARFFRDARRDITLLGSIGGHSGRGILNLFGAQDVNGTKTLASLDRISARFERWTRSPAVRDGIGESIVNGIGLIGGKLAEALAHAFVPAGITSGKLFVKAFFSADVWGKALIAGIIAKKLGAFGAVGKLLAGSGGKGGKTAGAIGSLLERGASPARPLFVLDVTNKGGLDKFLERNAPKAAAGAGLAGGVAAGATVAGAAAYAAAVHRSARRHGIGPTPLIRGVPVAPGTVEDAQARGSLFFDIAKALGVIHDQPPNRSRQGLDVADPFGRPIVLETHQTIRLGENVLEKSITRTRARKKARK